MSQKVERTDMEKGLMRKDRNLYKVINKGVEEERFVELRMSQSFRIILVK